MEHFKPLSELYQLFASEKLPKRDFEGMIFQYLLENLERFRLFNGDQDRWNDFLVWLYPRFAKAIDLYRDLGSSFDAYMSGLVNSAAKEYRCREMDHSITEYVCWHARTEEMLLRENEPEYLEEKNYVLIAGDISPRQILFLLLKSYFFVSDEFVEKVAEVIGMKVDLLQGMINELKKRRSIKEAEILDLQERLHCQHYRCLAYQKRMSITQPGTDYHEKMKLRLERAKKRFHAMKKRLGGMRLSASNRMIADVLGIPRGTVDSSLFSIKNRFPCDREAG